MRTAFGRREATDRTDELHAIVDGKLTAFIREMEEANWSAEDVALAIGDVLRRNWLDRADALQQARNAVQDDFISDGNEG
ncbi:MAG: hypothetical protein KDJ87_15715 [Rhizobiaceae bacterium]|nr:hypothetical protein [Rhizobiaceae bacterium]